MRSRCLVVLHVSPSTSTPLFVCATLGLALWLAHGPEALAETTFSIRTTAKAATARRN
ncbi:MAG: Phospholipid-binding protein [uncultured Paraburkholderia sp.]|nr:MAG: Phospholipid-binding protein [uncultured Paraburkholderia sp.]